MKKATKKWIKSAAALAGMAAYFGFADSFKPVNVDHDKSYPLPREVEVKDSSFPLENRVVKVDGNEHHIKVLNTGSLDLSKPFYIKTDRYKIINDNDWFTSRIVGSVLSTPGKLFFMDKKYAEGQDEKRIRAVFSMLEKNKDIKDITVRLNHNEAIEDFKRLFTEKELSRRNNLPARVILGSLNLIKDEVWAEFFRGSYYNPLARTVVCYSNIEAVTAHEIGHHKDFSRFDSDWEYALSRILPPVCLYQEWIASKNATEILSDSDQWQFNRYLLPAFGTYLLFFGKMLEMITKNKKKKSEEESQEEKVKKFVDNKSDGEQAQILIAPLLSLNASFYTGLAAYSTLSQFHPSVGYAGFAMGTFGASYLFHKGMMKFNKTYAQLDKIQNDERKKIGDIKISEMREQFLSDNKMKRHLSDDAPLRSYERYL